MPTLLVASAISAALGALMNFFIILLNNLPYDLSQSALPLDRVDASDLRRPRALDMVFIRRYMALFGRISSALDALTFWILLHVLRATEALFRTGWFIESLVSQVLVVFVIRTRGRPWTSRPATALTHSSLAAVVALLLPFTRWRISPRASWSSTTACRAWRRMRSAAG